jgi:hypothetical protein
MNVSKLLQIINEELEDFYDLDAEQSMADRYFNTQVAAPKSPTSTPEVQINAELIGYVDRQYTQKLPAPIPVYKNPETLEGFSNGCRGVLLENGDFYCATSVSAMHDNILDLLGNKGIIPIANAHLYWKNLPEEFVAVQRYGETDQFTQSVAYDSEETGLEFPEYYLEIFRIANSRQPYDFKYVADDNLNEVQSPLDPNNMASNIPQGYEHKILDEADNIPPEVQQLYQKSLQFKDPKFYQKSNDGGIYYNMTWNEVLSKIKELQKYGWTPEKIAKRMKEIDVYGSKKPITTTAQLNKRYNHPSEIPFELYQYIRKNLGIISSDASDAVRWSRIINTRDEERYPDEPLTIYRAVDNKYDEIREGDWVTTDENYAQEHMARYLGNNAHVISMEVNGRDVLTSPTGNYEEAIYAPMELSYPLDSYN